MMKKLLALSLALALAAGLTACGGGDSSVPPASDASQADASQSPDASAPDSSAADRSAQEQPEDDLPAQITTPGAEDSEDPGEAQVSQPVIRPLPADSGSSSSPAQEEPSITAPPTQEEPPVSDPPASDPEPAEDPAPQQPEPQAATADTARAYIGQSVSSLIAAIGSPLSQSYAPSCLGPGEDGELIYDGFTVYTYRENGVETVQDVL